MATELAPNVRINFFQIQPNHHVDSEVGSVNSVVTSSRNPSSLFPQRGLPSDHSNGVGVVNPNQNDANPVNQIVQRDIAIEVAARPSDQAASQSSSLLLNNNNLSSVRPQIVAEAARSSFALRHPFLAKLFSSFVAVISFPVLVVANAVVTPFLMGAAAFSKVCGSGELAKDIGASAIAKVLWGDEIAKKMEEGRTDSFGLAIFGILSVFGLTAPGLACNGAIGVYSKLLNSLGADESFENIDIQRAINNSKDLNQIVQLWVDALPENEGAMIEVEQWKVWANKTTEKSWTGPLGAVLEKLYDGAPKNRDTKKIPPEFATRMGNVLKVIQYNHIHFTQYISTLGLSGLGTCVDRPLTVFLDLELRTQARQTLMDIKEGKKSLQNMLDIAVKRLIFDETFKQLASEMQKGANPDPIEAMLHAWKYIQENNHLDIPALPYILYGTSLSKEETIKVAKGVVAVVTDMKKHKSFIVEFLTRDESPVPWKEAVALLPLNKIQSEAKTKALEALKAREDALEPPDTSDYSSPEYKKYLGEFNQILTERKSVESRAIELNGQGRWVLAEI